MPKKSVKTVKVVQRPGDSLDALIAKVEESEELEVSLEMKEELVSAAQGKTSTTKAPSKKVSKIIPAFKSDDISTADLQKEIDSVSLSQAIEIQAKRRVYTTGSIGLDAALNKQDPLKFNGGLPELAIVETYGRPGVRKSNFWEYIAFEILEDDPTNIVVFLYTEDPDTERLRKEITKRGIDPARFQVLGLFNPAFPEAKNQLAEKQLYNLVLASSHPNVKLIVIDSLKALVSTTQMYEKGGEKSQKIKPFEEDEMAIRAKLMEKLFNRLLFQRRSAILGMTNQMTDKIPSLADRFAVGSNDYDKTPCGRRKEFLSVVRIHIQGSPLYEEKELKLAHNDKSGHTPQAGILQYYKIKKNRWGRPNIKVTVPFDFLTGRYDNSAEAVSLGVHLGIIKQTGAYFTFPDGSKVQGREAALVHLDSNPKLLKRIEIEIITRRQEIYTNNPAGRVEIPILGATVDTSTGEVIGTEVEE